MTYNDIEMMKVVLSVEEDTITTGYLCKTLYIQTIKSTKSHYNPYNVETQSDVNHK